MSEIEQSLNRESTNKKEDIQVLNGDRLPTVILDTCIFVSAKRSRSETSNPIEIIKKWREGYFNLILTNQLIAELDRKLHELVNLGKCEQNEIEEFLVEILSSQNTLYIEKDCETNSFDEIDKDDNLLAAAMFQSCADYLVTYKDSILEVKYFQKTQIITTNLFLRELEQQNINPIEKKLELKTEVKVK